MLKSTTPQSLTCHKHVVVCTRCGHWLCEGMADRQSLLRHGTLCSTLMELGMWRVRRRHVRRWDGLCVSHFIKASDALRSSRWSRSWLFVFVAATREMAAGGVCCVYSSLATIMNVHHHWKPKMAEIHDRKLICRHPWACLTPPPEFKLIIASSFSLLSVFSFLNNSNFSFFFFLIVTFSSQTQLKQMN